MSIGLRIVILLVFAYGGWQAASVEFRRNTRLSAARAVPDSDRLTMKKPKPPVESPQPRQVQRADLAPTTGYAIVVDGHFKTEFVEEGAAKKAAATKARDR